MKKMTMALLLALVMLASACSTPPATSRAQAAFTLRVTVSSWNGWDPEYVPEERVYTLEVAKIKFNIPAEVGAELAFAISGVGPDGITITTTRPMSDNGDGTIDLGTWKTQFTLTPEQPLELIEPYTDSGTIYVFELIKEE